MIESTPLHQVTVLTHIITPYQVELFDAVARQGTTDLRVIYLADASPHRDWNRTVLGHPAIELAFADKAQCKVAQSWASEADVLVAGHYRNRRALEWMRERNAKNRPWCIWGERPGFRFDGIAGRAFRAWKLRSMWRSRATIWGIGSWAVEGWRREFGKDRRYFNVPYFSDLTRFSSEARRAIRPGARRILFSGSLIERKGIDALVRAFLDTYASRPALTLDIVGAGNLRAQLEAAAAGVEAIRFHGFQQWQDLPRYYAQADILCVPSRYDGWGLVVPEGLAAGLPVIATDRMGAARDLVSHGANGWIAEAGSREALGRLLATAADLDDEVLGRMSVAALASVREHQLADGVRRFEAAVHGTLEHWQGATDPISSGRDRVQENA